MPTALENELEFRTVNAVHWQEWAARDYLLMKTWRETGDTDDFINAAAEHAYDSRRARMHLFALIDLKGTL